MPSALPDGVPAPPDGSIPLEASAEFADNATAGRPFGIYVHVPFCTTRCGYCDFNTYTADRAGPRRQPGDVRRPGGGRAAAGAARARRRAPAGGDRLLRWRDADAAAVGGPGPDPARHRRRVRAGGGRRGHDRGEPGLGDRRVRSTSCATAGFTRISLGMQSAVAARPRDARPHAHARPRHRRRSPRPARPASSSVSLDLIYGTPGESGADWQTSLDAAVALRARPRLGVRARSSRTAPGWPAGSAAARSRRPDDDVLADRYLQADETLAAAGLAWYEVSQLGPRRRGALPAQPGLLARRRLVGRRTRRAQPRGRCALVEREAPAPPTPSGWPRATSPAQAREVLGRRRPRASSARCCSASAWPRACRWARSGAPPRRGRREARAGRPARRVRARRRPAGPHAARPPAGRRRRPRPPRLRSRVH